MQCKPTVNMSVKVIKKNQKCWILTRLSHVRADGLLLAAPRQLDLSQTELSVRMKPFFLIWLSLVRMLLLSHTFSWIVWVDLLLYKVSITARSDYRLRLLRDLCRAAILKVPQSNSGNADDVYLLKTIARPLAGGAHACLNPYPQ